MDKEEIIVRGVAARTGLPEKYVAAIIGLLDEGATVPFISRYRLPPPDSPPRRREGAGDRLVRLREPLPAGWL